MKAVVAAFNQEKALVGAFSVITDLRMELFQALEGGGRQDRGQLRLRGLPARDGAARQGRLRGPRLGSVRPRGARAARTQD